ncbi:MAG: type I-E CRISPR-associated protein Cas5/CasD [Pontibacterium sp.]
MDYLVFRLYGPMVSWGDIAVGETRNTHHGPTKSAILGLVAGCLGIERGEEETHLAMASGYQLATAVQAGSTLRDYHTVQAPDSVGKFTYRSRRDELTIGKDRLGTVLSSRTYRTDAHALVVLRCTDTAPFTLAQLQSALQQPKFIPFLGRKSCPLAAPMAPSIISAESIQSALDKYDPIIGIKPYEPQSFDIYWEGEQHDFAPLDNLQMHRIAQIELYDQLKSRKRWQFEARRVWFYPQEVA